MDRTNRKEPGWTVSNECALLKTHCLSSLHCFSSVFYLQPSQVANYSYYGGHKKKVVILQENTAFGEVGEIASAFDHTTPKTLLRLSFMSLNNWRIQPSMKQTSRWGPCTTDRKGGAREAVLFSPPPLLRETALYPLHSSQQNNKI